MTCSKASYDYILYSDKRMGIQVFEGTRVNAKGRVLYTVSYMPEAGHPKGILFYIHGLGNHSSEKSHGEGKGCFFQAISCLLGAQWHRDLAEYLSAFMSRKRAIFSMITTYLS